MSTPGPLFLAGAIRFGVTRAERCSPAAVPTDGKHGRPKTEGENDAPEERRGEFVSMSNKARNLLGMLQQFC